ILVETAFSAISSGTELHAIHSTARPETTGAETYPSLTPSDRPAPRIRNAGTRWDRPLPRPPHHERIRIGYSLAGTVLAVSPEVTDVQPGDRVACSGNQCASHAERVAVPRNLAVKVPEGVSLEQASFVTLGSIALHALRRANCQLGEMVVVHGLGL